MPINRLRAARRFLCLTAICSATALNAYQDQRPTFRGGVDLLSVDAQVIDHRTGARDHRPEEPRHTLLRIVGQIPGRKAVVLVPPKGAK